MACYYTKGNAEVKFALYINGTVVYFTSALEHWEKEAVDGNVHVQLNG